MGGNTARSNSDNRVLLGRIVGVSGLQGWLKIHSDTRPREAIGQYRHWQLGRDGQWHSHTIEKVRPQGKRIVGKLQGCNDREAAEALLGMDIAIERAQLASLAQGQYYWRDLLGLQVIAVTGDALGIVERVFDTGSNDVLVVRGASEHLIPWDWEAVIKAVDLDGGSIRVEWDPDF